MANTGTFRSALNGFNRQDVMDYLESAAQRYELLKKERNDLDRVRTEQEARLKELEEAQAEFTAQKEMLAQFQAEAEQLRQQLTEAQAVSESLKEQYAQRSDQLAAQQEVNEGMRRQLVQITAEKEAAEAAPKEDPAAVQTLHSELEALKAQLRDTEEQYAETARRAAEFDSLRDRIATLELNASRRAADIEQAAQSEARALLERTEKEAAEILTKARQEADSLLDKARREDEAFALRREESYRDFSASLRSAVKDTEASSGLIAGELTHLTEKLKGIMSSMTDTALQFEPVNAGAAELSEGCPVLKESKNERSEQESDSKANCPSESRLLKAAEATESAPAHHCSNE